jgi:tetratricopeptide (TPR) repeat protein
VKTAALQTAPTSLTGLTGTLRACAVLIAILAAVGIAAAQGEAGAEAELRAPIDSAEQLDIYLETQLEDRWWRRKELLERRGVAAASEAASEMIDFMRQEGIERLPEMSDALILEGRALLAAGDLTGARESFRFACELDRDSSAAWWSSAAAEWQAEQGLAAVARLGLKAASAGLGEFWSRYAGILNLLYVIVIALLVTAVMTLVVLFMRHAPALVHAVDEKLPPGWHPAWRRGAGWLVVLAPVGTLFLGLWATVVWAVALLMVPARRPRWLLVSCIVVIALAGPVMRGVVGFGEVSTLDSARTAVDFAEGTYRPGNLTTLGRLAEQHPDKAMWKMLLARSLGLRDPDRTVSLLRASIELRPDDPDPKILLGNAFFRLGKSEQAGVLYRDVLASDPENLLATFNLARVRLALFEFDEAERLVEQIRDESEKRLAALESASAGGDVVDPPVSLAEVAVAEVVAAGFSRAAAKLRPLNWLTLTAGVALLIGLVFARAGGPSVCERCGSGICARCAPGGREQYVCTACTHLASPRAGLAPAARAEQARRVERHLGRLRRGRIVGQAIWPGLPLIHEGRLVSGLVLAGMWAALVVGSVSYHALLPAEHALGTGLRGTVSVVLMALVWIAAQATSLRPGVGDALGRH